MKLVECVPNFSEGKNKEIIDAIAKSISSVKGVKLLDVDPGADTNRTVITFIGPPEAVKDGAFEGIKTASKLIDMTKHKGAHSRMGATDVCPFIPVSDVTLEECIQLSRELGEKVARELNIPIYLYEYSATTPKRKNLANIREGEYEALPEKLKDPNFKPDFGEAIFNTKSGATVIGAREFLIAYNINLNTTDSKFAKKIANRIREKGVWKLSSPGKIARDEKGNKIRIPGLFKDCKATGWYIDQYKQAQVTMNLTNYKSTPIHLVFDKVCELAQKKGLRVTGSELVGLIPKQAMIMAGQYYLSKQKKSTGIPEKDIIRTAIQSLGLEDITEFNPQKKIIEYTIEDSKSLNNLTLKDFTDELSSESPAPGGGSVAALCGSLSAALSSMVANLTIGKKQFANVSDELNEVAIKAQELKKIFIEAIDKDTAAFNNFMSASKIKAKSPQEKEEKNKIIDKATKEATLIPLEVLQHTKEAVKLADKASQKGNPNALSDAGVAAAIAKTAAQGAWYNIMINLKNITDNDFKENIKIKSNNILETVKKEVQKIEGFVKQRLID